MPIGVGRSNDNLLDIVFIVLLYFIYFSGWDCVSQVIGKYYLPQSFKMTFWFIFLVCHGGLERYCYTHFIIYSYLFLPFFSDTPSSP